MNYFLFILGIKLSKLFDFSWAMKSSVVVFSWPTGTIDVFGFIYLLTKISLGKLIKQFFTNAAIAIYC